MKINHNQHQNSELFKIRICSTSTPASGSETKTQRAIEQNKTYTNLTSLLFHQRQGSITDRRQHSTIIIICGRTKEEYGQMEAIEKRLSNIEAAVFGAGKTSSAPPDTDVVSKLLSVAKECGNAAGKRERIAPVMRRTAELAKYTDPGFAENYGGLSPAIKADIVLAQEEKLRDMHR